MTDLTVARAPSSEATARACEDILRSAPDWFGIEESLLMYARNTARLPTWLARVGAREAGFITVERHFPQSAEIHCIAVRPDLHRRGVGRALLDAAEADCRATGASFLQVKTKGPSRPNEHYARTLRFYLGMGFTPLEEMLTLWKGVPCLLLVKKL
jgi:GNAT superfamily N-acetyltransferase